MPEHVNDQDLLRATDGELPARERAAVHDHLIDCQVCRDRLAELMLAATEFGELDAPVLPPADGPRALLHAQMAHLAAGAEPKPRRYLKALAGAIAATVALIGIYSTVDRSEIAAKPDPRLTPGATLPVSKREICAAGATETVRLAPASIARQVFASYGIHDPQPRTYELDYLITPALGGADSASNFWPQPYSTTWNARLKDALEDHLLHLVCTDQVELSVAQRDLSRDWIAAYRHYFHTGDPLPEHYAFLKDHPWEERIQ